MPLRDKLRALVDLVPTLLLMLLVLGSIYAGFATPTEAAALGVVGAAWSSPGSRASSPSAC